MTQWGHALQRVEVAEWSDEIHDRCIRPNPAPKAFREALGVAENAQVEVTEENGVIRGPASGCRCRIG